MNSDSEEEADPLDEVEETPIAEVEISDELRRFMNLRVSVWLLSLKFKNITNGFPFKEW